MSATIPDLWPADFGTTAQPSPASVLRQQGVALGQRTQNFVIGRVYSRATSGDRFEHSFMLAAPLLGFERPLLTVTHGISLYPATIALASQPSPRPNVNVPPSHSTPDYDAFVTQLREILQSEDTTAIVRSLIAQSEGRSESLDNLAS